MAVAPHRFGGLQIMLDLLKRGVWVAVVHQRIQLFHRFPKPHARMTQRAVFALFREHKIERLLRMVLAIELAHYRRRVVGVLADRS